MTQPSAPLLELRGVTKSYRHGLLGGTATTALDGIDLELSGTSPTIVAIAGESGSGKSTLGQLVLGLIVPTAGTVLVHGEPVGDALRRDGLEFRRKVQAIFQDPYDAYNPFYRIDHVFDVLVRRFRLAPDAGQGRELVRSSLRAVGLDPDRTLGRFAHQLSGGQAQRLMIARALLLKPSLIVADEPVSMVDASRRAGILDALREMTREVGASILYITHDLATAYQVSDRIVILHGGRIVESGLARDVIERPADPYTQLLVASVPGVDPDAGWRRDLERATPVAATVGPAGARP
jgi:ABC-type oligopeptide transport system ATPase subunit